MSPVYVQASSLLVTYNLARYCKQIFLLAFYTEIWIMNR